jgi:hypothetical protein
MPPRYKNVPLSMPTPCGFQESPEPIRKSCLAVMPRDSGFQIAGIVRSERRMEGKNQAAAFAGTRHVHAKERCRDGVAGGYGWICQLWSSKGTELTRVSLCVERATSSMFTCRHVGR